MRRRWKYLPVETRREIIRLASTGASMEEIRTRVDVALGTVSNVLAPLGGVIRPEMWAPSSARLSLDERVEIRVGLEAGCSLRAIARRWAGRPRRSRGRSTPTAAGRPMRRCGRIGRPSRQPDGQGNEAGVEPAVVCPGGRGSGTVVVAPTDRATARASVPDDLEMRVSHETIYKSLYVQGRGELRRELAAVCAPAEPLAGRGAGSNAEGRSPTWS